MLQKNVPRSAVVSLSRRSLKEFCHAAKRAWKHRCIVNVRRPGFREYRERRTLSSTISRNLDNFKLSAEMVSGCTVKGQHLNLSWDLFSQGV